jgi:integrase
MESVRSTGWCRARNLPLFGVRRADIETFACELEARGRARATVTRRLCTIAGFYKYAVEEELLEHSPTAHVRRPRLDYESHATGLDRNELGAILVAAGLGPSAEHALVSLLALNGLRVSEATGVDIEHMGTERGHRTLVITRKGGKVVTIPLAPRTARAIDLAVGERTEGPMFLAGVIGGWTGTVPPASSAGSPAAPGSSRTSARTPCATRSSPQFRRRGATAGRPGGCLPRRPPNHHALRPGTHQPGPARHLHRRRLRRRSGTVGDVALRIAWPPDDGQAMHMPLRPPPVTSCRSRSAVRRGPRSTGSPS